MTMRTVLVQVIVLVLAVLGPDGTALAGGKDGQSRKVGSILMTLHRDHVAGGVQATGASAQLAPVISRMRIVDDRVFVDAVADGDASVLEADLVALGMRSVAVHGRVVSGQLPIAAIPALERIGSLRSVRPSITRRRAGSVTSEGDRAMRADIARANLGVSGAGVKVGALSDSFNCKAGAAANVTAGDLSAVQVVKETPSCVGATDEGRALLQIVHDVAPAAALAFATTEPGTAAFANNILALRASGAQVIVDDIGVLVEPMFQDGIIAQAAETVVRQGATYVSAAGNDARDSYEAPFKPGSTFAEDAFPSTPSAPAFFGGTAHNFAPAGAPANHFQRITIPAGGSVLLSFQWDSPFASAGGAGSPNDVDIYLLNAARTQVVAGSTDPNMGGDAVELLSFVNTGATADFNLMIVSFEGPLPGYVKYISFESGTIQEFGTASGTVFGHPNAANTIAVGAAAFNQTPVFGVTPPVLEAFSSAGGTPIFFDTAGHRLATPVIRRKPDVVGPDDVSTTVPGFSPFPGTSASAPHVAGVAALMLQKQPALAPVTMSAALRTTAVDMGPSGFDFDSGFGLVQADAAVNLVTTLQAESAAILPSSRSVKVGNAATAFATVINAGPGTAIGVGLSLASALPGNFTYQTTDPNTNALTGTPNTPVNIPPGGAQTYILSITPSAAFPGTDVQFSFAGANTFAIPPLPGINTLLLTASDSPVADIIALAATGTPGLTAVIPGSNGSVAFAVATSNVGVSRSITVSPRKGSLPIAVFVCRTNASGACISGNPAPTVTTTIGANETSTFSFFVQGQGVVPFDPSKNRIFTDFIDAATGAVAGSTSVAVRTGP